MSARLLILGLCSLVLLAGCRIMIVVPAGGWVQSSSGDNDCAEGKNCPVDVVDLFFNDTFTARPAAGFQFKQWKVRDRGFCGGDKKPCHLFTSGFAGNAQLMEFLDSNDTFYLQPQFEPKTSDDGPVSKQNASVCFNDALLNAGSSFTLKYRSVSEEDGRATIANIQQTNMGGATFKGQPVSLARAKITVSADGRNVVSRSDSYFKFEANNKRSTSLGGTGETFVDGVLSGSEELEFVPGILTRYDLAAGQSYSQTYTTNSKTSLAGNQLTDSRTLNMTTTYIGVVPLDIEAGNYQACKFEETISGNQLGFSFEDTRTYWWGVGIGVMLKEESESSASELVSGSINGSPI